jgi:hypothetical protein
VGHLLYGIYIYVFVLTGEGQQLVMLEQFPNSGDDRDIADVYVQGQRCRYTV